MHEGICRISSEGFAPPWCEPIATRQVNVADPFLAVLERVPGKSMLDVHVEEVAWELCALAPGFPDAIQPFAAIVDDIQRAAFA